MNRILLALLAATFLTASQAEAGDKPRKNGGYNKPNHGQYHKPKRWKNNFNNNRNSFNNNRVYNNRRVYNYNYKYENDDNGWYAFGGFLGGLAVGGAIGGGGGGSYYYYDQPGAQCTTIFERRWNVVYQEWENIPQTVCGGY
jgi:hypothetical protein